MMADTVTGVVEGPSVVERRKDGRKRRDATLAMGVPRSSPLVCVWGEERLDGGGRRTSGLDALRERVGRSSPVDLKEDTNLDRKLPDSPDDWSEVDEVDRMEAVTVGTAIRIRTLHWVIARVADFRKKGGMI